MIPISAKMAASIHLVMNYDQARLLRTPSSCNPPQKV